MFVYSKKSITFAPDFKNLILTKFLLIMDDGPYPSCNCNEKTKLLTFL